MGDCTVSLILNENVQILKNVLQSLNMPQPTVEKFKKTAAKYHNIWNFSQCLGAIDGKHVRIICPAHADTKYFNCKSYYSILLPEEADATYEFTTIDVGGYDMQSDGDTFRSSRVFQVMRNKNLSLPPDECLPCANISVPYVFVADEECPLLDNSLKPFSGENLDPDDVYFNKQLYKCRKTIESAFGILYSKNVCRNNWRKQVAKIVKATCVLKNVIIEKGWVESHLKDIALFPAEIFLFCLRNIPAEIFKEPRWSEMLSECLSVPIELFVSKLRYKKHI